MADIEALDQKITALAEQSHANDVAMMASLDEPAAIDLSEYRKYNDLTAKAKKTGIINLTEETKRWEAEGQTTSHILPFHEGAHLVGYLTNGKEEEFDVIFKTKLTYIDRIDGGVVHYMSITYKDSTSTGSLAWNELSGAIADTSGTYPVKVTLAEAEGEIEVDDTIVLKSDADSRYALKSDVIQVDLTDYVTIDDVNTVLTENYVQKKDLPAPVDLTQYRQKDDLSVRITGTELTQLPITMGPYAPEGLTSEGDYTSFVEFHEGAHLVGKTGSSGNIEFDTIFKTENTYNNRNTIIHDMAVFAGNANHYIRWEEATGAIYDIGGTFAVKLTLAEAVAEVNDTLALKSENEELKAKIEQLTNNWWKNFYSGFVECGADDLANEIQYFYGTEHHSFDVDDSSSGYSTRNDYLLIFTDRSNVKHFIRINQDKSYAYLDEIYGPIRYVNADEYLGRNGMAVFYNELDLDDNYEDEVGKRFDAVYMKP